MRILLVTVLLVAALPAYGSVIFFSGGVTGLASPPPAALPSQLFSDSTIYGFAEQQNVLLTTPLNVGISTPGMWICCAGLPGGTIPAGVTVDSYLLYASPETAESGQTGRDFQGWITFSPGEKILGIIVGYQNIAITDNLLGAPGTIYPPISDKMGGLEPNDRVILGPGSESVYVDFRVAVGNDDMIRILTSVPEPANMILIGSGLIALALITKRRRFGRTKREV